MFLAYELKIPLHEIVTWTPEEVTDWLGFFQAKNELEAEAYKAS